MNDNTFLLDSIDMNYVSRRQNRITINSCSCQSCCHHCCQDCLANFSCSCRERLGQLWCRCKQRAFTVYMWYCTYVAVLWWGNVRNKGKKIILNYYNCCNARLIRSLWCSPNIFPLTAIKNDEFVMVQSSSLDWRSMKSLWPMQHIHPFIIFS